jgi:hypothetical protein
MVTAVFTDWRHTAHWRHVTLGYIPGFGGTRRRVWGIDVVYGRQASVAKFTVFELVARGRAKVGAAFGEQQA